jgi:general secretion pathway protein G
VYDRARDGAGRRRPGRAAGAFTLIEILIVVVILGILAAIVVPQFSNASHVARENMLKDELRYLRTQIAVYKAEHRDVPPGFPNGSTGLTPTFAAFQEQMTNRTSVSGKVGADPKQYRFGPYLQKIPPNPLTQLTEIKVLAPGVAMPKQMNAGDLKQYGWVYKPDTQEIVACSNEKDGRGRAYMEY